jgi:hypothetical protein
MKNYTQSDYSLNKNAKGIIYRFADQIVEITLEDYLRENPNKSPADFAELKALSDSDYYETDRADYRQTWKNTSLDTLGEDEMLAFSAPSVEEELIDHQFLSLNAAMLYSFLRLRCAGINFFAEVFPANPSAYGDESLFFKLRIEPSDQLVGIGFRNAHFCGNFFCFDE